MPSTVAKALHVAIDACDKAGVANALLAGEVDANTRYRLFFQTNTHFSHPSGDHCSDTTGPTVTPLYRAVTELMSCDDDKEQPRRRELVEMLVDAGASWKGCTAGAYSQHHRACGDYEYHNGTERHKARHIFKELRECETSPNALWLFEKYPTVRKDFYEAALKEDGWPQDYTWTESWERIEAVVAARGSKVKVRWSKYYGNIETWVPEQLLRDARAQYMEEQEETCSEPALEHPKAIASFLEVCGGQPRKKPRRA